MNHQQAEEHYLNYIQAQQANSLHDYHLNIANDQANNTLKNLQQRQSTAASSFNNNGLNQNTQNIYSQLDEKSQFSNNQSQQNQMASYSRPPNDVFMQPAFLNQNAQIANYSNVQLGAMPLAFPPSFSHQLATLSLDQQKYLLEQQRALVLTMAATEQMAQLQMNQQG